MRDLIKHKKGVLITDFADLKEFLIIQVLKDGLPRVKFINKKNNKKTEIKFDEKAYQLNFNEGAEYASNLIRGKLFCYECASNCLSIQFKNRKKKKLKQQKIPAGFNKNKYETKKGIRKKS